MAHMWGKDGGKKLNYCTGYNSKTGCSQAGCQRYHACNVIVGGKVCGSKSHGRYQHDVNQHGKPDMLR